MDCVFCGTSGKVEIDSPFCTVVHGINLTYTKTRPCPLCECGEARVAQAYARVQQMLDGLQADYDAEVNPSRGVRS